MTSYTVPGPDRQLASTVNTAVGREGVRVYRGTMVGEAVGVDVGRGVGEAVSAIPSSSTAGRGNPGSPFA